MQDQGSSYASIRFANRIWIDEFVNWKNVPRTLLRLILVSATPYIIGLGIAFLYGETSRFVETLGFVLGSVGLALTLVALSYGSHAQYDIYDRLLRSFALSNSDRDDFAFRTLERHSNFAQHIRAIAFVLVVGFIMLFLSSPSINATFTGSSADASFPLISEFHEHGWYDQENFNAFAWIAAIYILFMAPALGTTSSIIVRMPILLWQISGHRPAFPPALIKIHFAPAARFYAKISLSWLVGFGLMFYLFLNNRDPISIMLLLTVFFAGIANFVLPQIAYARTIVRSEEEALAKLSNLVTADRDDKTPTPLLEDLSAEDKDDAELILQMTQHDDWVYPLHQTYAIAAVYLFSLASSIATKTDTSFFGLIGN